MNVIINTFCNLHCPYCFAADVIDRYSAQNCMTMENFETVLTFLRANNQEEVRIIGGEPTLHPHFIEFLNKAIDYGISNIMIFTNGLFKEDLLTELIDISKRVHLHFLFNVNEPRRLKDKYELLVHNIETMSCFAEVHIGINFYSKDQEWKYIVELARDLHLNNIRWSLTIPNVSNVNNLSFYKHFQENKENLMAFFQMAAESDPSIGLHEDCNALPMCMFNTEELVRTLKINPEVFTYTKCDHAVIDVAPDLRVYKCFGFSNYGEPIYLTQFSNMDEINEYFDHAFNNYREALLFPQCASCLTYKRNGKNSCGCWKYRSPES